MAVRKFEFTVREDGITPAVEQRVGLQNEFKATQLVFNIEDRLYSKLSAVKGDGSLVYRFDCYDSVGGVVRLDTNPLESTAVTYDVGEYLTRYGGKAAVYIVISVYNGEDATELELISYPAKLRFESIPFISTEERESLSTLAEVAKNAAKRATVAEAVATTAQGKTEQAQRALESGSEFFFDGGTSSGHAKTEFVIDDELSETSENLVKNKAVALKFKELAALISSTVSSAVAAAIAQKNEKDHPVGSFFTSTENVDPATLYGGTWERIKGRVIWGIDDGETAGCTGGTKEETLTTAQIPSHTHKANSEAIHYSKQHGNIAGAAGDALAGANRFTSSDYPVTQGAGGGQPHNNMMPYYGAYVWRRTA